jgi:haloacetate dehalogenase
MANHTWDDFTDSEIETGETTIFVRRSGNGPPLLLLHGFPETHLMWRRVAPLLASRFSVVCSDLRGYGRSGCPASSAGHAPYSKRAMARDMVKVMEVLGFAIFSVAGHDRGGRVAYRLALDHPSAVDRLAVLDIVPTEAAWERADDQLTLAFWPWSLLAQPEPFPEQILTASAAAVIENALSGWGSPKEVFPSQDRASYLRMLKDPVHAHAICEEYRAAATIDRDHDRADQAAGHRISCPTLVLWSSEGGLDTWYREEGGPIALWREWSENVTGHSVEGGHFFPEEFPEETARILAAFYSSRA